MSRVGAAILTASVAGLLLAGTSAQAQNWLWDAGGSPNNKYETPANWTFGPSSPTLPDNTVPVSQGANTLAVQANGPFTIDFDATTGNPSIYEFRLYCDPHATTTGSAVAVVSKEPNSITLSWSWVEGSTYSLQRSTNLVHGFTTIESGIPVHEATNFNVMATPQGIAFYRVVLDE